MRCEAEYCIYNKSSVCLLEKIQIDALGMCDSFETVSIPPKHLAEYKQKRLNEIAEQKT